VDVSEIGLQPLARRMGQGDEGLASIPAMLANVPPDLVIAAEIALFIAKTPIELGRGVTLFAGGLLIGGQDLIDQCPVRAQPGCRPSFEQCIRTRFALLEHLANLPPGMAVPPGDLPNAHPIPVSNPDLAIIFHRQHPFSPSN